MRGLSRERLQRTRTIRRFDRMTEPGQEVSSLAGSAFQNGSFNDVSQASRVLGTLSRLSAVSRRLASGDGATDAGWQEAIDLTFSFA